MSCVFFVTCSKREVPQQNYVMHVAHCARNMAVCPVCGDAVPKAHLQQHRQQEHALVECPACCYKVQAGAMQKHRETSCGRRIQACQFCELELPHNDLPDHESYCGARTERCEDCGELLMLRYRQLHLDSNHGFLKLKDEPGPNASWEKQNGLKNNNNIAKSEDDDACCGGGESRRNSSPPSTPGGASRPWDVPRTFVPAYDASDDLRAKVKLARSDLYNIKKSYLVQGEERVRQLQQRAAAPPTSDLLATNRAPRQRFTTNLVPYEKNKSHQVNALPDEERNQLPQALPPLDTPTPLGPLQTPGNGGFFNYLGAREQSSAPLSLAPLRLNNDQDEKQASKSTGAVPRPSRKKGPAPPVPTSPVAQPPYPVDTPPVDEVTLPCEFCDTMVSASKLVQHETGCRPDLAQLRPLPAEEDSSQLAAPPASPEVQLPCEFCCSLIPASRLLSHQALCDA